MLLKLIIMTAVFLSIADPSAKVFVQQSSEPKSDFYSNNRSSRVQAITRMVALVGLLIFSNSGRLAAQTLTFAGNAQHRSQYSAPAQHLNTVHWSTLVDLRNSGGGAHYGAPLITASNTVLVPIRTTTNTFLVSAFDGPTGRLKYTLSTDYILPSYGWVPVCQPVLANGPLASRLYYPGAGGTVYYIENPDSDTPSIPVQECFYTNLVGYAANAAAFNNTI